jgi:hypothetical protein
MGVSTGLVDAAFDVDEDEDGVSDIGDVVAGGFGVGAVDGRALPHPENVDANTTTSKASLVAARVILTIRPMLREKVGQFGS